MVILHFTAIENNPFNGVCLAAPQHVISQKKYADTGVINIKNTQIKAFEAYPGTQMDYKKPFVLDELPAPFNSPDIVVFHECYRLDYLRVARELKRKKIPYVDMPHGELNSEAQKKKHFKKWVANILLFKHFTNGACAIQCLSEDEKAQTHFGKRKILISNGVHIPDSVKTTFHQDEVKFLYIGRLDAMHKGLDILIEAASRVKRELMEAKATIDIYGPDYQGRYAHVQELIEQNRVKDVVFLHHEVSGTEKEKLLLNADVFIQTSRFEGMPLGVLEALSYGLPCLVTKGTNLGEEIQEAKAGWYAETDVDSVAEKILKSLDQKEQYRQFGENGRAFVSKKFSWDKIAQKTICEYEALLK